MAEVADNSQNVTQKVPIVPAVATAADPSWTEGRVVPLSVDLAGKLRGGPVSITGPVTDGGSGKTLKRAVVALTATGDVIVAVSTKRLKVFHYAVQSRADGMTVQFRDGAAGALLGLRWGLNNREGAVGGAVNPPAFLFATIAGNALQAVISGTGTVDIEVTYWDDDIA